MDTYKIADVTVNMKPLRSTLKTQAEAYLAESAQEPSITIHISDAFIEARKVEYPQLGDDECEYIWSGSEFYHKLLDFNGFMLHSSAVAKDGKAFLFSAKSGTGKSTHTGLWQQVFGEEDAVIINDDKPAVRRLENQFFVYGTPWSGKTDKNMDIKVPLHCIVFIERSEENWVNKIESREAIKLILNQTLRPRELDKIDKLVALLDGLLKTIPVYKMGCNISEDAVKLAYETLK